MHRSSLANGNKVYQKRIIEQEQQRMEKRVRSAQAQVDTSTPSNFDHTHSGINKKKYQIQEQQNTEIERENRILLEKITRVMRESSAPRSSSQLHGQGGSHHQSTTSIASTVSMNGPPLPAKRSLNAVVRRKDQEKILAENQNLLKRLQNKKSDYQTKKPPTDSNSYRTIDSLQLPSQPQPPSSSQSNRSRTSGQTKVLRESRSLPRAATIRLNTNEDLTQNIDSHKRSGSGYLHEKQQTQQYQSTSNASKHVLLRKQKKVGAITYLFEISLENNLLRITADDTTSKIGGVQKVMEMSEQDGFTLLATRFDHSLDSLFESLTVTDRIAITGLQVQLQQQEQQQLYHVKMPKPSFSKNRIYQQQLFAANYSEIIEQPDLELSASNLFTNKKKQNDNTRPPLPLSILNQLSPPKNKSDGQIEDTTSNTCDADADYETGSHEEYNHESKPKQNDQNQGVENDDEEENEKYSDDVFDEYSEDHYDNDESLKIKEIQEEKRQNILQGENYQDPDQDDTQQYEDDCEFLEDQDTILDKIN